MGDLALSERTPRFTSFRKSYGGDPDSAILRDLHKRLMKVEIALNRAKADISELTEESAMVLQRLKFVLVAAGGTVPSKD